MYQDEMLTLLNQIMVQVLWGRLDHARDEYDRAELLTGIQYYQEQLWGNTGPMMPYKFQRKGQTKSPNPGGNQLTSAFKVVKRDSD